MTILLGCIADDFTGATDLANTLVKEGMRTTQVVGVPDDDFSTEGMDAVVVALKIRTNPAEDAISQALAAYNWLRDQGAEQYFWKYCSTFDSTAAGNIGPVADALLDAIGSDFTLACPAFPTAGRTLYNGHLFVGSELLSDSGMKDHPLTPMRDANLVSVLQQQTKHPVGLVAYETVRSGAKAITDAFGEAQDNGTRHVIVDAITDSHLRDIGEAGADLKLITGGSGIALGLPENFRRTGKLDSETGAAIPTQTGEQAILSGSCSVATRAQIAKWKETHPAFMIDAMAVHAGADTIAEAMAWRSKLPENVTPLFYSSADPTIVAGIQADLGRDVAGAMIEETMGKLATALVERGVTRLIVAGGETSGAVVQALGVTALTIGPEIDPGVPWTTTHGAQTISLALKSGNFGGENFFAKAFGMLP